MASNIDTQRRSPSPRRFSDINTSPAPNRGFADLSASSSPRTPATGRLSPLVEISLPTKNPFVRHAATPTFSANTSQTRPRSATLPSSLSAVGITRLNSTFPARTSRVLVSRVNERNQQQQQHSVDDADYTLPSELEAELFRLQLRYLQEQHRADALELGMRDFAASLDKTVARIQEKNDGGSSSTAATRSAGANALQLTIKQPYGKPADLSDDEAYGPSPVSPDALPQALQSSRRESSFLAELLLLKAVYDQLVSSAAGLEAPPVQPALTMLEGQHEEEDRTVQLLRSQVASLTTEVVLLQHQRRTSLLLHAGDISPSPADRSSNLSPLPYIEEIEGGSSASLLGEQSTVTVAPVAQIAQDVAELEKERDQLRTQVAELTRRDEMQRHQLEETKAYSNDLEARLLASQHKSPTSESHLVNSSLSELYARCAATDQLNSDLFLKNQQLEKRLEEMEHEHNGVTVSVLEARCAELEAKLAHALSVHHSEHSKLVARADQDRHGLNTAKQAMERMQALQTAEIQQLQTTAVSKQAGLDAERDDLLRQLAGQRQQAARLQEQPTQQERLLADQTQQFVEKQSTAERQLAHKQQQLETAEQQLAQLAEQERQQRAQQKHTLDNATQQLLQQLEQQRQQLQETVQHHQAAQRAQADQVEELKACVQASEAQCHSLQQQLDQQTRQVQTLLSQTADKDGALHAAQQQCTQLRRDLLEQNKAAREMAETIKTTINTQQLLDKQAEMQRLLVQSCDAESALLQSNQQYAKQVARLQADVARLEKEARQAVAIKHDDEVAKRKQTADELSRLKRSARQTRAEANQFLELAVGVLATLAQALSVQLQPPSKDVEARTATMPTWIEQSARILADQIAKDQRDAAARREQHEKTLYSLKSTAKTLEAWRTAWTALIRRTDSSAQLASASLEENASAIVDTISERLESANALIVELSARVNELEDSVARNADERAELLSERDRLHAALDAEREAITELQTSQEQGAGGGSSSSLFSVTEHAHQAVQDMRETLSHMNSFVTATADAWSAFLLNFTNVTGVTVDSDIAGADGQRFDPQLFAAQCTRVLAHIRQLNIANAEHKAALNECAAEVNGSQRVFNKIAKSYADLSSQLRGLVVSQQIAETAAPAKSAAVDEAARLLACIEAHIAAQHTELVQRETELNILATEKRKAEQSVTARLARTEELRGILDATCRALGIPSSTVSEPDALESLLQSVISAIVQLQTASRQAGQIKVQATQLLADAQKRYSATVDSLQNQLIETHTKLESLQQANGGGVRNRTVPVDRQPLASTGSSNTTTTTVTTSLITDQADRAGRTRVRTTTVTSERARSL
ncbi:hypothetical protein RI367_000288 [Sorochytrium milnesiophthora]